MEKFKKCGYDDCQNIAQWIYMPGYSDDDSPYSCDTHVHRGCSCNTHSIKEEYRDLPEEHEIEGKDWEWINESEEFDIEEPNTYWRYIDEKGRPYPCCEYEYSEIGFYTEEYKEFLQSECDRIGYDILSDEKEKKWFDEIGYIIWTDELIIKIEKIIENNKNGKNN